jgi:hypothetical protein
VIHRAQLSLLHGEEAHMRSAALSARSTALATQSSWKRVISQSSGCPIAHPSFIICPSASSLMPQTISGNLQLHHDPLHALVRLQTLHVDLISKCQTLHTMASSSCRPWSREKVQTNKQANLDSNPTQMSLEHQKSRPYTRIKNEDKMAGNEE